VRPSVRLFVCRHNDDDDDNDDELTTVSMPSTMTKAQTPPRRFVGQQNVQQSEQ